MGIWPTISKLQNKIMQKQKWYGDLTPVRVFKSDIIIDVKLS